jgi:hypothetical protein
VALRAVETIDFMTARWAHLPYELLETVSGRIINEIEGISRVSMTCRASRRRRLSGSDGTSQGIIIPCGSEIDATSILSSEGGRGVFSLFLHSDEPVVRNNRFCARRLLSNHFYPVLIDG